MNSDVDCLFIGHNQIPFEEFERAVRKTAKNSGAFRDLSMNTLRANNVTYNASSAFNQFCVPTRKGSVEAISHVEAFSAAIAYLGSYVAKRGFSFHYINAFQEQKAELQQMLSEYRYFVIVVITTLYVSGSPIIEVVRFIKDNAEKPFIAVGGPFVATKARTVSRERLETTFKSIGADVYVNSSQGEAALVEILRARKEQRPLSDVPNIFFRSKDRFVSTETGVEDNPICDNMVDWSLFDPSATGRFVNVRTAISCPFSCSFCGFPEHAGKYQYADVSAVERELDSLVRHHPAVRFVTFTDDTFNVPPKRFKEILKMLIRRDYPFGWHSFFRCQFADEETVDLMKRSKCQSVFLGIESGSDAVLRHMNKGVTIEKYKRGVDLLQRTGIVTFANFIIGFPGETEKSVDETIKFIDAAGVDFFRAQLWYYEHITPIWRQREKYGIRGEGFRWSHSSMDSRAAADALDRVVLSVRNATRFPQHYFDYDNAMQLTYKGLSLEDVRQFLAAYDEGVKEKLRGDGSACASRATLELISSSIKRDGIYSRV